MKTTIQKWGNSYAVRIPRSFIKEVGLDYRTDVELTLEDGKLVIQGQRGMVRWLMSPSAAMLIGSPSLDDARLAQQVRADSEAFAEPYQHV